jgi:hypothetical protein
MEWRCVDIEEYFSNWLRESLRQSIDQIQVCSERQGGWPVSSPRRVFPPVKFRGGHDPLPGKGGIYLSLGIEPSGKRPPKRVRIPRTRRPPLAIRPTRAYYYIGSYSAHK